MCCVPFRFRVMLEFGPLGAGSAGNGLDPSSIGSAGGEWEESLDLDWLTGEWGHRVTFSARFLVFTDVIKGKHTLIKNMVVCLAVAVICISLLIILLLLQETIIYILGARFCLRSTQNF